MSSIYAGEQVTVQYNPETKTFGPEPVPGAEVFTVRSLDYFEAQAVMSVTDDAEKVRKCLALGLVLVDGNEDKAKAFLQKPKARLGNPLFTYIWELTWGN